MPRGLACLSVEDMPVRIKRLAKRLAPPLAIGLLVACGALPPSVTPGSESLSGRVTFNNQAPPQPLTVRLRTATGTNTWTPVVATTTQTDANGNFSFTSLAAGRYQPYWDDQGQVTQDPGVNTAGVAVPDPVEVTANQTSAPSTQFDVYWPINPNPTVGATISVPYTFAWAPKPNLPSGAGVEYQVFVKRYNATSSQVGSDVWSSGWGNGNSVAWNGNAGSTTNTPTGAAAGSGAYVYQVKYRKAGGTFGGGNFYGQTKWIPFNIQ